MEHYRPLILRANRFLGSALAEKNLVPFPALEAANEKLLEVVKSGNLRQAWLLRFLFAEDGGLDEAAYLEHLVEHHDAGLMDLHNMDMSKFEEYGVDPDLCWATATLPFDKVEGFLFLATANLLSQPILTHWEKNTDAQLLWFAAPVHSLLEALERVDTHLAEARKKEKASS